MATPSFPQASLNDNNGDHQHIDADVPVALERYVFLSIILFSSIYQPLPPHQQHGNDPRDRTMASGKNRPQFVFSVLSDDLMDFII